CYYQQYVSKILIELNKVEPKKFFTENIKETCRYEIVDKIIEQISNVTTYSLIDFYNYHKKKSNISYKEFNNLLKKQEFVDEFHLLYPLIPTRSITIIENYTLKFENIMKILLYYKKDILQFLNVEVDNELEISYLNSFDGDFHKETFVVIVGLYDRKIVIKKRTNLGERILNIVQKYFKKEFIDIPVAKTLLLSNDLCIQEYIKNDDILDNKELKSFYFKFGVMAGIFTALGSKDLHSENMIANINGPYFIDLEAAITSEEHILSFSFLKESYLFDSNEQRMVYGMVDLSAFSGGNITSSEYSIKNKGKDDISLGISEFTNEGKNIPKNLRGVFVNTFDYRKEVIDGFIISMNILKKYKSYLIEELKDIEDYTHRLVLRDTGFYAKYLHDLNFPLYTKNLSKTQNYIKILKKRSIREKKILDEEVECLEKNIIPYFTSSDFENNDVTRLNFINHFSKVIDGMDKELHYLNMILSNDATEEFKINFSSSKNRVFSEIKAFENYCSTEDLFKYGVTDYSVTDRLLGYYNDLFTFGGSILTFNNIISNTKKLDKVLNTVNFNRCNFYISGLTGYQSGLLLKYILGQETKNYLSAREMALKNDDIDFSTYGSAIVILDYLYRQTDKLEYLKDIKFLGEKYLENIGKHKLTGMLHGYAGDLIVLNVLFHYYNKNIIIENIEEAIKNENIHFDSGKANWRDSRVEGVKNFPCAISYGSPGIIISRLILLKNTRISVNLRQSIYKDIKNGVLGIISQQRFEFSDDTLINGYAGAVLTLKIVLESKIFSNNHDLNCKILQYVDQAKKELTCEEWRYAKLQNIFNPSFANGRIGTIFVLWYITADDPERFSIFKKILRL
ncbi:DUF4135 domain-containing protein, partial [Lactococcus piscium]